MPYLNLSMLLSGQYHQWFVSGFSLSIKPSVLAFVLALSPAITVALLRLAPVVLLCNTGQTYVEATRNVSLLAHMLFWYFGAPQILPEFIQGWLYSMNYEAVSAVIAFVLYTATYMAEDICSGIRSIPKEQPKASRALGLSFLQAMQLVVLSQSLRVIVLPLVSQTLDLWENSSVAAAIGVAELMHQVRQVESAIFRGSEVFAFAAAVYPTISIAITVFSVWYQHRYPVRTLQPCSISSKPTVSIT